VADHNAIAAVGQAIRALLVDAAKSDPTFSAAHFDVFQSTDFQKAAEGFGVSIYLYRVSTNQYQRNLPPRIGSDGKRHRPPLPLDLHYMLTPWGPNPDIQHRLLGWAMRVLEDSPIVPAAYINSRDPDPQVFRPDETVEIVFDPLSLQDLSNLWEVMEPKLQPTATYVARRIDIESEVDLVDSALVQTRDFGFGELVGGQPERGSR